MTARSNHASVGTRIVLAMLMFVVVPVVAQSTKPATTHQGAILYVPPPRTDGVNWIGASSAESVGGLQAPAINDAAWQRTIATHVPLVAARSRLARATSDPNSEAVKTVWFNRFKSPAEAASWLAQNIHVEQIPGTALIEVWITGEIEPTEAGKIVEDIVTKYLDERQNQQNNTLMNRKTGLDQLRSKHETAMRQLRQETSRLQGELQMDNSGKSGAIAQKEAELFQLVSARVKTERELSDAKLAYESAQATVQAGATPAAAKQMIVQVDAFRLLTNELSKIDIEIQTLPKGEADPQYKQLSERRAAMAAKLELVQKEQLANATVSYMDQLNSRFAGAQHQLEDLSKNIEKLRLDISDLSFQLAGYVQRNDEINALAEGLRRERNLLDLLNASISTMDQSQIVWVEHPPKDQ